MQDKNNNNQCHCLFQLLIIISLMMFIIGCLTPSRRFFSDILFGVLHLQKSQINNYKNMTSLKPVDLWGAMMCLSAQKNFMVGIESNLKLNVWLRFFSRIKIQLISSFIWVATGKSSETHKLEATWHTMCGFSRWNVLHTKSYCYFFIYLWNLKHLTIYHKSFLLIFLQTIYDLY